MLFGPSLYFHFDDRENKEIAWYANRMEIHGAICLPDLLPCHNYFHPFSPPESISQSSFHLLISTQDCNCPERCNQNRDICNPLPTTWNQKLHTFPVIGDNNDRRSCQLSRV